MSELCIHDIDPATCSVCLHGLTPRVERGEAAHCRSCGAEIVWVVTEKGKKMPIDVDPSEDGRFRKIRVEANGDKRVAFVKDRDDRSTPLYSSHFETCPDAKDWKRS